MDVLADGHAPVAHPEAKAQYCRFLLSLIFTQLLRIKRPIRESWLNIQCVYILRSNQSEAAADAGTAAGGMSL